MTIKRIILIFITILVVIRVVSSLIESFNQPQIQSRLELYQTNLVLHAAEFNPANIHSNINLASVRQSLLSNDPYLTAQKQYEKARKEIEINLGKLIEQSNKLSEIADKNKDVEVIKKADLITQKQLSSLINESETLFNDLSLKLGILQAVRGDQKEARKTWGTVYNSSEVVIGILIPLWNNNILPDLTLYPNLETLINDNLDGWFRYKTLVKLYELQKKNITELENKEQIIASQAITKLLIIGMIPLFGAITGVSLLIFLLTQLLLKKEESLLATNHNLGWQTPWDGEIIWQVLIIGFFFIGQFLLPLIFGISGFNPSGLTLRYKAFYVLLSYLLMASGGILVLYYSIKEFFPLPKTWFKFNISIKDFFWGFGGYLVAIPLVVLVSLINQQFWQGQGGSNPILSLALQSQDKVALGVFFLTASVAAPMFEELIFRGFLLPSLTRYLPVWGSILISSVVFAIAHLSISEVLPLTTLGIVLGFVYTRSRNLLSPMILHSFWNSGTLLSLFILGS